MPLDVWAATLPIAPPNLASSAAPISISFSPAAPLIADSSSSGTFVTTIIVTMADGSQFAGTLGFTTPNNNDSNRFVIAGSSLNTGAAALTPDGTHNVTISATQNGVTITQNLGINIQAVVGVTDLSITLSGGPFAAPVTFNSASNTVDKGNYVGEFVSCKRLLCTNAAAPDWRVWFQVDIDSNGNRIVAPATGWLDEIVVEFGRSIAGTPNNVTTSYTATISKGGVQQATYTVPKHWWYARWRYQASANGTLVSKGGTVRPVVRTAATLLSRKWLPNLGHTGVFTTPAPKTAFLWPGPMGAPGFVTAGNVLNQMGAAGDNVMIGHVTESAADYIINGTLASLSSCLTEGEWVGDWPIHIRDDNTGSVLDVRTNILGFDSAGGTVHGFNATGNNALAVQNFNFMDLGDGDEHFYPCASTPWMLTDDPYFLEEMQFGANWMILLASSPRQTFGLGGLVSPAFHRAFAWGLRELLWLGSIIPSALPGWLQPKSYWANCVTDCYTLAIRYPASPNNSCAIFRNWPELGWMPTWQLDWLNFTAGRAIDLGYSTWQQVFDWAIQNEIQRGNGISGWPRQRPDAYTADPNKLAAVQGHTSAPNTTGINKSFIDYAPWKPNTPYAGQPPAGFVTTVIANGNLYFCTITGTSAASGTGPSGTGSGIVDGSCQWNFVCVDPNLAATTCTSWTDFWNWYSSGEKDSGGVVHSDQDATAGFPIADTTWNGTSPFESGYSNDSYLQHYRASLVQGIISGNLTNSLACKDVYAWFQPQLASLIATNSGGFAADGIAQARFSIDPPKDGLQALLAQKASGSWTLLNATAGNGIWANAVLPRTIANFGAGGVGDPWSTDAAVGQSAMAGIGSATAMNAYSGVVIRPSDGRVVKWGAGHSDGGDSGVYMADPIAAAAAIVANGGVVGANSGLTWTNPVKSARYRLNTDAKPAWSQQTNDAFDPVNNVWYWADTNADGIRQTIAMHSAYLCNWVGGTKWALAGFAGYSGNANSNPGQTVLFDDSAAPGSQASYTLYSDQTVDANSGKPRTALGWMQFDQASALAGVVAYCDLDDSLYFWANGALGKWQHPGSGAPTFVQNIATSTQQLSSAGPCMGIVIPDPVTSAVHGTARRALFYHQNDSPGTFCLWKDITGTPTLVTNTYQTATGLTTNRATRSWCYNSKLNKIMAWEATGSIFQVTPTSNGAGTGWTYAVLNASPTGDLPTYIDPLGSFPRPRIQYLPYYDCYIGEISGSVWVYKP